MVKRVTNRHVFAEVLESDLQGPVVQSWVSANPGLKFNPLF